MKSKIRAILAAVLALQLASVALCIPKPALIFEIEEGFVDELIYRNRLNPAAMNAALLNVVDALAPLSARYDVSVLIYPVSLYDRNAYGAASPQPIECFHAGMRNALQYFESRFAATGVGVLLEMISSGNDSKQNGNIYSLAPAPLHNTPGAPGVWGLAFDLETLAAAKAAYPNSLHGVRFHETHYPVTAAGALLSAPYDIPATLTNPIVDACKAANLKLVWNNSVWLQNNIYQYDQSYYAYVDNGKYTPLMLSPRYKPQQDYAVAQLGPSLAMLIANNNYHPAPNINLLTAKATAPLAVWEQFDLPYADHPLKTYPGLSVWGVSNQSWFWMEAQNTVGGKYYAQGELDCPVESLVAAAREAFAGGAQVVQFEPGWDFFNNGLLSGSPADGTPTDKMLRMRAALLNDTYSGQAPPTAAVWDRNLQRLLANKASDPAAKHFQSTLWVDRPGGQRLFDFLGGAVWLEQGGPERVPAVFASGTLLRTAKVSTSGNGMDMVAAIKQGSSGAELHYYQTSGRYVGRDRNNPAAPNASGAVAFVAAANLVQEIKGEGDPDEILLGRAVDDNSTLAIEVCRMSMFIATMRARDIRYAAPYKTIQTGYRKCDVVGLAGLRDQVIDYVATGSPARTNPLDRFLLLAVEGPVRRMRMVVYNATGGVQFSQLLDLTCQQAQVPATTADADSDGADELVVLRDATDGSEYMDVYDVGASTIVWAQTVQVTPKPTPSSVAEWRAF
ncbi:MAG: hypothetical protein WCK47_08465 [bacterium]|nr:hypothetical protein [Candidatus Sumerlaeota bacterium]